MQGDGVPPSEARDFCDWLSGDAAPQLPGLGFSVCALGDTCGPNPLAGCSTCAPTADVLGSVTHAFLRVLSDGLVHRVVIADATDMNIPIAEAISAHSEHVTPCAQVLHALLRLRQGARCAHAGARGRALCPARGRAPRGLEGRGRLGRGGRVRAGRAAAEALR